jgi:hypothetical protein
MKILQVVWCYAKLILFCAVVAIAIYMVLWILFVIVLAGYICYHLP